MLAASVLNMLRKSVPTMETAAMIMTAMSDARHAWTAVENSIGWHPTTLNITGNVRSSVGGLLFGT
jgi:hypothetical protein